MRSTSIRFRVTAIGVLTLGLVLGVGAVITVQALRTALRSDTNAQNEAALGELADEIEAGADVSAMLLPVGADGTDFVILNDAGETLNASISLVSISSDPFIELVAGEPSPEPDVGFIDEDLTPEEFAELLEEEGGDVFTPYDPEITESLFIDTDEWFETRRLATSPTDGELTLVALSPLGIVDRSIDRLALALAIIVPVLVLLGGLALWYAIGASLRPVRRIAEEAERIAPSTSSDRLPVPDSGDEIAALTRTLNGMLDRLDAGLERQRQFVSDASHELRSPLTAVKGAAGLVDDDALPTGSQPAMAALHRGVARLEDVLDDLTRLADEGSPGPRAEVDLADLVRAEVAAVEPGPVSIDTSAVEPVVAEVFPVPFGRAVQNLVKNAATHATSTVVLAATVRDGRTVITVDDDGPGIPAADRVRIFERFVRLDQARSRSDGGSGLGLALVASIAEAHDGSVVCTASPDLGGARFILTV